MKNKDFRGDILIIDDTPANLRLLTSILQERGFKTRAVVNGKMALTAAHTAPPDLILLDITMPDMSGYDVCEKLKSDELTREIPIIFISALDATEDKIKAFTSGGVDYITKPFQIEEVMARVQTHLALRAMQRSLQQANRELRQLSQGIEQSPASVVITDLKGNITYVNPQFSTLTGYSFAEALGKNPRILKSGETPGEVHHDMWQTIKSGKVWKGQFLNKKKNGELYWEDATIGPVLDHDGQIINFVAVKIDVTDQKRAGENLVRMNRILAMLSAIKQALMHASDETTLLSEICHICVELGGYRMAWVGYAEEDEAKTVRPIAHHGFEDGYLDKVKISWADVETGRGPTGVSIRTRQPAIARNILNEPHFAPWRSDAIKRGYASSSSFPLIIGDRVFGALAIYATAPDAFDQQEIDLLTELAENISYGLETLQNRAIRRQMETEREDMIAELRKRNAESESLRETTVLVTSSLDVSETVQKILQQLRRVLVYDTASVWLYKDGTAHMISGDGIPADMPEEDKHYKVGGNEPDYPLWTQGVPYVLLDDVQENYPQFRNPPINYIHSWMCIPLKVHDTLTGIISLDGKNVGQFTHDDARLALNYANQVSIAVENARLYSDLENELEQRKRTQDELQWLAQTDSLTGLFNRRHFFDLAEKEFAKAIRYNRSLSVILFDVDLFKGVNDTYGHLAGDQALNSIGEIIRAKTRSADIAARYGGEEFIILVPETDINGAQVFAEHLRELVERSSTEYDGKSIHITISVGVAGVENIQPGQSIGQLIALADKALYTAKASGRNQVVVCNTRS